MVPASDGCSPGIIAIQLGGVLTANRPIAVTTLLFSLSVKACSVFAAKLGSASVRPFPWICLGGIFVKSSKALLEVSDV